MAVQFDLIVLGGAPAGTSGAASAGLLGKRTALIERLPILGGAGINTGTIPSKTLRETALVLSGLKLRELYGVNVSLRGGATVADVGRHARNVTGAERDRTVARLDLRGGERFRGAASFVDPHTIRVVAEDEEILLTADTHRLTATVPKKRPRHPIGRGAERRAGGWIEQ